MADDEIEKAMKDAATFGVAFMRDGKRVDPADVYTSGPDLLPCPFCGETKTGMLEDRDHWPTIICVTCGARGPSAPWSGGAREHWNTRAAPALRPMEEAPRDGVWILAYFVRENASPACAVMFSVLDDGERHWVDDLGIEVPDRAFAGWLPLPEVKR